MKDSKNILRMILMFGPIALFWFIEWYWVFAYYNLFFTYTSYEMYHTFLNDNDSIVKYPLIYYIIIPLIFGFFGFIFVLFQGFDKKVKYYEGDYVNEIKKEKKSYSKIADRTSIIWDADNKIDNNKNAKSYFTANEYDKGFSENLNCREVIRMLKSRDYVCRASYTTEKRDCYFQIKDDVNVEEVIKRNINYISGPIKYLEIPKDGSIIESEYCQDQNIIMNQNKPFYRGSVYIKEDTCVGEGKNMIESLEDFINEIETYMVSRIEDESILDMDELLFDDFLEFFKNELLDSYNDYEGMWSNEGDTLKVGFFDSNFEDIISYFKVNINYPTQESIYFNLFIDTA